MVAKNSMIASVYIKESNIHFYNEKGSFSAFGGIVYELGKPLLNFVCYEPQMFMDAFTEMVEAFDNEHAHTFITQPDFVSSIKESMSQLQQHEQYVFLYGQMLMDFLFAFVESPKQAIMELEGKLPGSMEKLNWALDFEWPVSKSQFAEIAYFTDKEKRLFRAANDVIAVMYEHLCKFQKFIVHEIEVLLHYRKEIQVPDGRSIDYVGILDEYHMHKLNVQYYLEKPFKTFYGRTASREIEQLYVIDTIEDLFRFEFIKMIDHEIYIKKCKNCERFFIPLRRVDAEYCNRIFGDTERRCNEIGAMLRYERKVAENPVWEVYKKAYRRLNSRTRNKKMTQAEFLAWSDEAGRKRDECLAGNLKFDDFVAWLEQGRVCKPRNSASGNRNMKVEVEHEK